MAVLVDSNVIIDVLSANSDWKEWSKQQLKLNREKGLLVNPAVYAELCFGCPDAAFVDDMLRRLYMTYQEMPKRGLFRAAKAYQIYKSRKGTRTSVLPDFFIGGHAEASGHTLLTRDAKRMQGYFPEVRLICP